MEQFDREYLNVLTKLLSRFGKKFFGLVDGDEDDDNELFEMESQEYILNIFVLQHQEK